MEADLYDPEGSGELWRLADYILPKLHDAKMSLNIELKHDYSQ